MNYITTVTWHRIIRPDGAFVREEAFDGVVEYGPMPEEMMLPFISEREAFFQGLYDRLKRHDQKAA